ncbi:hypothetical protein OH491_03150 [Termitidicoccus mucosus]|uniref:Cell filamentation protein Fic n=1 Tax=Termitidicoccus mucosus TaxID=1184151 RepID=A0A178ILG8_9BACT|nr:hypothetical protein AW736_06410 [Opitutaceae bacterium TSB47]
MANEIIFYRTPDGEERIEVVFRDENFWMTQKALADLFAVGTPAINKHLKNIYESGELEETATISKMERVRRSPNSPRPRIREQMKKSVVFNRSNSSFQFPHDSGTVHSAPLCGAEI